MKAFYCDHFVLPLPAGHRFPMAKYSMLRNRVVGEGVVCLDDLHVPYAVTDEDLVRVHTAGYVDAVVSGSLTMSEQRRIGFPWSPGLVERSRRSVGGTVAACLQALDVGVSANLAGGTHHAFADAGEGFCVFNDSAVAARFLQARGLVDRILILDCDVHQGNGTAAIFNGDSSVTTFSMHGANNYPFRKQGSDVDVPLRDGTGDREYLDALERHLATVLTPSRYDLAVYVSGADPFVGDRLGRLSLSKEGLASRDRIVFDALRDEGIPVAVVMAGGYASDVVDTVDIHLATLRAARESHDKPTSAVRTP